MTEMQTAHPTVSDLAQPTPLVAPAPTPQTPETPETAPQTPEDTPAEAPRPQVDLSAIINGISAFDWLKIRRELDLTAEEICEDSVAMSLVGAVMVNRRETGLDQWEKFKPMTPEQLAEFLSVEVVADGGDATKSV